MEQRHVAECVNFLNKVRKGEIEGLITGFHVDNIVMERYGAYPKDIKIFLNTLISYRGLKLYYGTLKDRMMATNYMGEYGLDFDDAPAYTVM